RKLVALDRGDQGARSAASLLGIEVGGQGGRAVGNEDSLDDAQITGERAGGGAGLEALADAVLAGDAVGADRIEILKVGRAAKADGRRGGVGVGRVAERVR